VNGSWCNPNPGYFKPKHDNDLICAHQLTGAYRRDQWKLVVQQEEDPYFQNSSANVSGSSNLLGASTGWLQKPTPDQACWETPCLFNLDTDPLEQHNVAAGYPKELAELLVALAQYNATMIPDRSMMGFDPTACPRPPDYVWMPWKSDDDAHE
jgi:hypothetical protein